MYPLREDGWISLLQHLLEFLIGGRSPRWKETEISSFRNSNADAINFLLKSLLLFIYCCYYLFNEQSDCLHHKYRYYTNSDLIIIIIIYIVSLLYLIMIIAFALFA